MKYLIALLLTNTALAFTLNNNFGAGFKKSKVKVYVAADTTCSNAGVTAQELSDLINPAIDNFWNQVPTSALRLRNGGFAAPIGNDINADRLCSPTDTACINSGSPIIPPVSGILIACNANLANFGGAGNVLAVTVPNNFSGKKITGAVILINDDPSAVFRNLSHKDKVAVLAHEIGHAIGLGHAENKNKEALMYYKTVDMRSNLSQDDIDGVSYLYPVKLDGCGLMKTIDDRNLPRPPSFLPMALVILMLAFLFEVRKLLSKRGPAL